MSSGYEVGSAAQVFPEPLLRPQGLIFKLRHVDAGRHWLSALCVPIPDGILHPSFVDFLPFEFLSFGFLFFCP